MSLAFIPSLGTAISAARLKESVLASGIVNTIYQIGSAQGLAIMTVIAAANGADRLGHPSALTDGFSAAFVGAAIVALAGAILTSQHQHWDAVSVNGEHNPLTTTAHLAREL